jgi:hypothetical protein
VGRPFGVGARAGRRIIKMRLSSGGTASVYRRQSNAGRWWARGSLEHADFGGGIVAGIRAQPVRRERHHVTPPENAPSPPRTKAPSPTQGCTLQPTPPPQETTLTAQKDPRNNEIAGRFGRVLPGRMMRCFSSLVVVSTVGAVLALGAPGASGQAGRGASAAAASLTVQSMPSPAHALNFINAISCASANSCMAVGNSTRHHDITHALTEYWNGAQWSMVSFPHVPGSLPDAVLNGVSCPTQNLCMAVGYFDRNLTLYPLAARWNGHRWFLQSPSNQGGRFFGQLEGVSCPNTRMCMAVGQGGTSQRSRGALAERWNGRGWTATIKHLPHAWTWTAVSCPSTSACMATAWGWSGTFNGRGWSIHKGPNIASPPAQPSVLSCASATSCMAVGPAGIGPRSASEPAFSAYWNGRGWTDESVPYPPPPPGQPTQCVPNGGCIPGQSYQYTTPSSLTGVSCLASDFCQAFGSATDSQNGRPTLMAPQWDGSSWSTPAPPSTPPNMPRYLVFSAVSCVSGDVCEMVGGTQTSQSSTLEAARYG